MNTSNSSTVRAWLELCERGEASATQKLWDQYFERLSAVAEQRLGFQTVELEGEDIALSAIKSLVLGVRNKRFPQLKDETSLWPLLVSITIHKAISQRRRELAAKRDRTLEVPFVEAEGWLAEHPSPELVAEIKEELDQLYRALDDPQLQKIVDLRLAGHSNEEIAQELGCAKRTVIRKTKLIRAEWLAHYENEFAEEH